MDKLIESLLQVLYKKRDACDRVATELDTITADDLTIRFYEGKVEAYQDVINMLTNNKTYEETR
jgi:hypothetical protein